MKRTVIILAALAALPKILTGTEVCGNVSGVWSLAGSPYYVTCDVTVPAGQTIEIRSGVQVLFTGHYKFNVYGNLQAIGTEQDSIVFTADTLVNPSRWDGIKFDGSASSTSLLSYCRIENGLSVTEESHEGAGVRCGNGASPTISHCTILRCRARWGGGANVNSGSSPFFSSCVFADNSAEACGGGICFSDAGPASVSQCTFIRNRGESWQQASVCIYLSPVTVSNSIVAYSPDFGVVFDDAANSHLEFCDVFGSTLGDIRFWSGPGDGPINVGETNDTNVNGDSCDQYHNIFLDPLFVDAADGDFHLQAESPCINAGDPSSPLDPDGSLPDIGVFWNHSDIPLPVELASLDALASSGGIQLSFSTASETDNDLFEILRGTSEAGAFARIATLPSQGNSATGHSYEYLDRDVTAGQTYWYYLADVDLSGNRTEHRELMRSATMTGSAELPSDYALSAYPNPFNPSTTISFALPEADVVRIAVFDVAGRWIQTLVNEKRAAGNHTVSFDARDLPSGVYFARMESGRFAMTKKMALIR